MKNLKVFLSAILVLMAITAAASVVTFAFTPILAEAHARNPDREAFYSLDWSAIQDIVPKQFQEQGESHLLRRESSIGVEEWPAMAKVAFSMLPIIFSVGLANWLLLT